MQLITKYLCTALLSLIMCSCVSTPHSEVGFNGIPEYMMIYPEFVPYTDRVGFKELEYVELNNNYESFIRDSIISRAKESGRLPSEYSLHQIMWLTANSGLHKKDIYRIGPNFFGSINLEHDKSVPWSDEANYFAIVDGYIFFIRADEVINVIVKRIGGKYKFMNNSMEYRTESGSNCRWDYDIKIKDYEEINAVLKTCEDAFPRMDSIPSLDAEYVKRKYHPQINISYLDIDDHYPLLKDDEIVPPPPTIGRRLGLADSIK